MLFFLFFFSRNGPCPSVLHPLIDLDQYQKQLESAPPNPPIYKLFSSFTFIHSGCSTKIHKHPKRQSNPFLWAKIMMNVTVLTPNRTYLPGKKKLTNEHITFTIASQLINLACYPKKTDIFPSIFFNFDIYSFIFSYISFLNHSFIPQLWTIKICFLLR